ncbi:hypothetical protein MLC52_05285 [Sulfurimonas sp. NW15]|uniref:hypothetical protein n=1 Tax=Sulfurimonas sp. NW15 TaxID=2922729 RepID=UPI003DA9C02E
MINETSIEVQLKELAKTQQLMMETMEAMNKKLEALETKVTKTDQAELVTMLKEMEKFLKQMDEDSAHNFQNTFDALAGTINNNADAVISYVETAQKFIKQTYAKIEEESQKLNRSIGATQNTTRFS